jgi:hypothetical protein
MPRVELVDTLGLAGNIRQDDSIRTKEYCAFIGAVRMDRLSSVRRKLRTSNNKNKKSVAATV